MKYYEIQEYEACVRSILSYWEVKEEAIDDLIKDDVYLNEMKERTMQPQKKCTQKQAKFVLEEKRNGSIRRRTFEGRVLRTINLGRK
ncbi:hypothetical protein LCGC14_2610350 [marine sediment metagenome]|uniref:Uncharacterized protein n=1 Tax=marine sediment metagenome TaxID=412755 RepID=A0A0F9CYT2_9ZZZZ